MLRRILRRFRCLRGAILRVRDEPVVVLIHQLQDGINQRLERFVVLWVRFGFFRFLVVLPGASTPVVVIFFGIVPVDERFDQLASVQFVVVVRVMHLEVVELQLLFAHLAGVDWHIHVLGNVLLLVLNVVRVQHLLGLPMMLLLLLLWMGLSLLRVALNWNLLVLHRNLLRLLILRLYRHLLLLVLGLLLLLLLLIVLLLGDRRLLLIVLLRLLVRLLLIVTGIDAGGDTLTECHRCEQRQG